MMSAERLLSNDIALIVEPDVYDFAFFGCLSSPNPVFVFHQTGNVGVSGTLDAGFGLALGKTVSTGRRCSRIVGVTGDCRATGIGICGWSCGLRRSTACNSGPRQDRDDGRSQKW